MNLNIDWILAMTVFVLLVGWSFVYYAGLFSQVSQPLARNAEMVNNAVIDFLEVDTYDITVRFNISAPHTDAVLFINLTWPDDTQNSTQVYLGTSTTGTNLTCNITDGILYWESDLVTGDNYFLVHFSNRIMDLNCTSTQAQFDIYASGQNNTIGWATEKKSLVSQYRIDMFHSDHPSYIQYDTFKSNNNLENDFRVEIGNATGIMMYGQSPLLMSDTYVKQILTKQDENNQKVNITVTVW